MMNSVKDLTYPRVLKNEEDPGGCQETVKYLKRKQIGIDI